MTDDFDAIPIPAHLAVAYDLIAHEVDAALAGMDVDA